ncbi:hypothetical protein ACFQDG_06040 [Natronoarchaeum mannanilyticum]|uniref:DUF7573 domain-containing protein n=1 Tax=Natronoarchaeum mannanilyticum TaxID=926360 RepID=A0AAV3T6N6_9EURY
MPDDSSLTDFFQGDSDADGEPASSDDEQDADSRPSGEPAATDGVDAATTVTYEWSDDGVACADCGEPTRRRWRDDGTFVCADCKDW